MMKTLYALSMGMALSGCCPTLPPTTQPPQDPPLAEAPPVDVNTPAEDVKITATYNKDFYNIEARNDGNALICDFFYMVDHTGTFCSTTLYGVHDLDIDDRGCDGTPEYVRYHTMNGNREFTLSEDDKPRVKLLMEYHKEKLNVNYHHKMWLEKSGRNAREKTLPDVLDEFEQKTKDTSLEGP